MRILHVSTYDDKGGASRAMLRLHEELLNLGEDSKVFVLHKESNKISIFKTGGYVTRILRPRIKFLDSFPLRLYQSNNGSFSPAIIHRNILGKYKNYKPDVIHLHWICHGFISVNAIAKLQTPIVWTMHDSWPFTGGCFVPGHCERYKDKCGKCPILKSNKEKDLSRWVWNRKKRAWKNVKFKLVAPSRWMAECAKMSSLFNSQDIHVIPNGLKTNTFLPVNRIACRKLFNIDPNEKIIVAGAYGITKDPNKGFDLLIKAIKKLNYKKEKIRLILFGESLPKSIIKEIPFAVTS